MPSLRSASAVAAQVLAGTLTFGEIVGSYKGTPDEYVPGWDALPCFDIPGNPAPYYPQGIGECGDLDMDFGSSPNLFKIDGKKITFQPNLKSFTINRATGIFSGVMKNGTKVVIWVRSNVTTVAIISTIRMIARCAARESARRSSPSSP